MINYHYYNKQLKNYILQFAAIFAGMQVQTGYGEGGSEPELHNVPIQYGSMDRTVASIHARNTQNTPITLPRMSCKMLDIEMAPERRHGVGIEDSRLHAPVGGTVDDLRVVKRIMPIPYNLNMELAFYASNTDESFQILEQIMLLFDPHLQLQKSDDPLDWTKLTTVELISMTNEENYPMGADRRIIMWSMNFILPIWIAPPADLKETIVKQININIGAMDTMDPLAFGTDGEPDFFEDLYASIQIDDTDIVP